MGTLAIVVLIIVILAVLVALAIWYFLRWMRRHETAARHRSGPRTVADLVEMRGTPAAVPPAPAVDSDSDSDSDSAEAEPEPAAVTAEEQPDTGSDRPEPAPAPTGERAAKGADTPWARGARMTGSGDETEPWPDETRGGTGSAASEVDQPAEGGSGRAAIVAAAGAGALGVAAASGASGVTDGPDRDAAADASSATSAKADGTVAGVGDTADESGAGGTAVEAGGTAVGIEDTVRNARADDVPADDVPTADARIAEEAGSTDRDAAPLEVADHPSDGSMPGGVANADAVVENTAEPAGGTGIGSGAAVAGVAAGTIGLAAVTGGGSGDVPCVDAAAPVAVDGAEAGESTGADADDQNAVIESADPGSAPEAATTPGAGPDGDGSGPAEHPPVVDGPSSDVDDDGGVTPAAGGDVIGAVGAEEAGVEIADRPADVSSSADDDVADRATGSVADSGVGSGFTVAGVAAGAVGLGAVAAGRSDGTGVADQTDEEAPAAGSAVDDTDVGAVGRTTAEVEDTEAGSITDRLPESVPPSPATAGGAEVSGAEVSGAEAADAEAAQVGATGSTVGGAVAGAAAGAAGLAAVVRGRDGGAEVEVERVPATDGSATETGPGAGSQAVDEIGADVDVEAGMVMDGSGAGEAELDGGAGAAGADFGSGAATPTDVAPSRPEEHAVVDEALLRTFGVTHTGDRPGSAPIVALSGVREADAASVAGPDVPVRVRVTGRAHEPVGRAAVALVDSRGRQIDAGAADDDGVAGLTAPGPGTYMAVVSAPRHQPGAVEVVADGRPVTVDVPMVASSSVAGSVWGADEAVADASVTVLQDDEVVAEAESGGDGGYRITDLAGGRYTLSVVAPGFSPAAAPIVVPVGGDVRQDVDLEPAALVVG